MNFMENFRKFANGSISESVLQSSIMTDDDISEYEADTEFMRECADVCMPTMLQMMLMDESAGSLDEAVIDAYLTAQDYLIGQGIISEAAAVHISNPKLNVVHLNKNAQINRLTTIITLKMGRKANHKAYKKYKLGQKIKKENMVELKRLFGQKAERLAKKLWAQTQKSAKVSAVVDRKKGKK